MKRNILLNPGPATTSETVKQALVVPDICPREKEFGQLLDGIKDDLVKVVHGGDEYTSVLFTGSGTGGMEAAITSAVPKGKKLLIVENGAYGVRMIKIAEVYNVGYELLKYPYGERPKPSEIKSVLEKDKEITHLAVVHHETTTGILNPIKEICQIAQQLGVKTIVDAMSSYAGIPTNVKELGIDYLLSSSNKCIQGMAGMVFVIFRKSLLEEIKNNRRAFYFDIYAQYTGFKNSGQMQFTPPVQVAYALRQAIDEYFEETEEGRTKRYTENWDILYTGLKKLGFQFLLPKEEESKILLAVKEPKDPNFNFNSMHDFLLERGFTIYPGKGATEATFRLSVLGDLHKDDIKAFLVELENYINENAIKVVY